MGGFVHKDRKFLFCFLNPPYSPLIGGMIWCEPPLSPSQKGWKKICKKDILHYNILIFKYYIVTMQHIKKLLNTNRTVFKTSEFSIIFGIENKNTIKNILQRMKKSGILYYHGMNIWSIKKTEYDRYEFASKIRKRSYISFETVLQKEWIIFQDYSNTITLASDNSLEKKIENTNYIFHKLNDKILKNPIGIKNIKNKYMIASAERAICDMIYLTKNYHFDNISNLNIDKLEDIKDIYNKTTALLINKLIKNSKTK